MIVKNEEAFLASALKCAKSKLSPDDIVVVDTGSTDSTVAIAMESGANIYDFEWRDDFSAARNFAAGKAQNDWIFVLDADEEIIEADAGGLLKIIKDPYTVGQVEMVEMTDNERNLISRLYNRRYYGYEGRIHEQITPLGAHPHTRKEVPVTILHRGYLPEVKEAKDKLKRNEALMKKELEIHPDDTYLLFQLGRNYACDKRDLSSACACFEKALSLGPDVRLEYIYNTVECYGYALINSGQYEKALKLRDKYAKHYDSKPRYRFLSAHVYQNNGMLIEAVESYESCIGASITDYSGITSYLSYHNIGVILECVNMTGDAVLMYEKCGDYEPALQRLAALSK